MGDCSNLTQVTPVEPVVVKLDNTEKLVDESAMKLADSNEMLYTDEDRSTVPLPSNGNKQDLNLDEDARFKNATLFDDDCPVDQWHETIETSTSQLRHDRLTQIDVPLPAKSDPMFGKKIHVLWRDCDLNREPRQYLNPFVRLSVDGPNRQSPGFFNDPLSPDSPDHYLFEHFNSPGRATSQKRALSTTLHGQIDVRKRSKIQCSEEPTRIKDAIEMEDTAEIENATKNQDAAGIIAALENDTNDIKDATEIQNAIDNRNQIAIEMPDATEIQVENRDATENQDANDVQDEVESEDAVANRDATESQDEVENEDAVANRDATENQDANEVQNAIEMPDAAEIPDKVETRDATENQDASEIQNEDSNEIQDASEIGNTVNSQDAIDDQNEIEMQDAAEIQFEVEKCDATENQDAVENQNAAEVEVISKIKDVTEIHDAVEIQSVEDEADENDWAKSLDVGPPLWIIAKHYLESSEKIIDVEDSTESEEEDTESEDTQPENISESEEDGLQSEDGTEPDDTEPDDEEKDDI